MDTYINKWKYTTYYYLDCVKCGKMFIGKAKNQIVCPECKKRKCKICGEEPPKGKQYCLNCRPVKEKKKITSFKHNCDYCGKEFETNISWKKYCCDDCKYKANFKPAKKVISFCECCGSSFLGIAGQKFCSRSCQKKFNRKKNSTGNYIRPENNIDDVLVNRFRSKFTKFEYIGGWDGTNSTILVECKDCGFIFKRSANIVKPSYSKFLQCPNCTNILSNIKQRKIHEDLQRKKDERKIEKYLRQTFAQQEMNICPICNSLFTGNRKYCSTNCSCKASKYDGYREKFPLKELYERDNGICWICGGICDFNDYKIIDGKFVSGKMYPSRDHVFPKSKGGAHDWNNLRLAHMICNAMKGDSVVNV